MNRGLLAAYSSPPITLILSVTQLCRGYFKHVFGALRGIWFALFNVHPIRIFNSFMVSEH